MRLILTILIFFLVHQISFAQDETFGQYRYSKYIGIQQQLQNQRANAIRKQRMYNQGPARNIRFPNAYNQYPNIQRSYAAKLTPRQRYSAKYYQSL